MPGSDCISRILIAQDDAGIRDFLIDALSHFGFEAHAVGDGQETVRTLLKERCSLLITDVVLPGIPGLQLAREIRARGMILPILMLSSPSELELLDVAIRDIGGAEVLVKPFGLQELGEAVHRLFAAAEIDHPDSGKSGRR